MRNIEVCFTPALLHCYDNREAVIVVIDVFRATSSIITAFENGVSEIIPVATPEEASEYKKQGFAVAGEREGVKLEFADFGNSPFNFTAEKVCGKKVVYTTTNGTRTIMMGNGYNETIIGSFINAGAVISYLKKRQRDVILLCAGWKDKFNLEDSLCAGYIASELLQTGLFSSGCDSVKASLDIVEAAGNNLRGYLEKSAQRKRLKEKNLDDCIDYCLTKDLSDKVPLLRDNRIILYDSIK